MCSLISAATSRFNNGRLDLPKLPVRRWRAPVSLLAAHYDLPAAAARLRGIPAARRASLEDDDGLQIVPLESRRSAVPQAGRRCRSANRGVRDCESAVLRPRQGPAHRPQMRARALLANGHTRGVRRRIDDLRHDRGVCDSKSARRRAHAGSRRQRHRGSESGAMRHGPGKVIDAVCLLTDEASRAIRRRFLRTRSPPPQARISRLPARGVAS